MESEALMIGRLLMVLVGLVLGMLGVITTVHSDHNVTNHGPIEVPHPYPINFATI
jgi:hypothetical protein